MISKWASSNNPKLSSRGVVNVNENDMLMGHLLSQKSGIELMQNCDLSPPLKVFSGSDKMVLSPMNRVSSTMGREGEDVALSLMRMEVVNVKKLELLKALRLSQTRAREAEKTAASFAKEKDSLCNVFLEDSLKLFA